MIPRGDRAVIDLFIHYYAVSHGRDPDRLIITRTESGDVAIEAIDMTREVAA